MYEIASLYPDVIDIKSFTEKNFKLAFTTCVTRCFGWSLPYTMVIPFADCANHFIIDNQYELFNSRLHSKKIDSDLTKAEETYFAMDKMRIDCFKHYKEDFKDEMDIPYKTKRYIKKLQMRNTCSGLTAPQFL